MVGELFALTDGTYLHLANSAMSWAFLSATVSVDYLIDKSHEKGLSFWYLTGGSTLSSRRWWCWCKRSFHQFCNNKWLMLFSAHLFQITPQNRHWQNKRKELKLGPMHLMTHEFPVKSRDDHVNKDASLQSSLVRSLAFSSWQLDTCPLNASAH